MKKAISLILANLILIGLFMSAVGVNAYATQPQSTTQPGIDNSKTRCAIILGDSRACGILIDLKNDPTWETWYSGGKLPASDGVFKKGNTIVVICTQSGGRISDGTFLECVDRMYKVMSTHPFLEGCKSYTLFNMFGINDCVFESNHEKYPPIYVFYDQQIFEKLGYINKVYQLNCGPIDTNGFLNGIMPGINSGVNAYNKAFKRDGDVRILDLNSYLRKNGYTSDGVLDDANYNIPSGLHYDTGTNMRVLNYILSKV